MKNFSRISLKWKIFSLVAVLLAAALVIVILRSSQIFKQDKEAFVKELTLKLSSSTASTLANRIATLQDKLIIFISSKQSLANTGVKLEDQLPVLFSRYQDFISIGLLTFGDDSAFHFSWAVRNPQVQTTLWPSDFERNYLSTLNFKNVKDNGRAVWRVRTPDGTWTLLLGFEVQVQNQKKKSQIADSKAKGKKTPPSSQSVTPEVVDTVPAWIVGFLPPTAFDDILNDFSTGLNAGFIVDNDGIAVAHSDLAQRWLDLREHPIVSDLIKSTRPSGAGDYKDKNGRRVIGSFDWIPKINLAVAVTTPRDKAFEAAEVLSRNIFYIGIVILLISVGTAILMSNYITGPLQKLAAIAAEIGGGNFNVPIDVKTNDEIGDLADSFSKMEKGLIERDDALAAAQGALVQSEKMSAFGQLSAGIAHEVKNPLAGILGHTQLAMGKIQNEDIKKHLEVIEKETRRCKTIVESLMKFARAEKTELKPTDLAQVCQDTINLVEHQLSLGGVKIYKDLKPSPMVNANANHLQQVLLNLMVNAGHAMEMSATKNLIVRVLQANNKTQIQIEDTGTGIPPDVQKKIFEPFFTTKPAGKGTGLGLSVSIGIVKDHKGEIYLKSEINKGTTFFIDIPIPEGAKTADKTLEHTHGGADISMLQKNSAIKSSHLSQIEVAATDLKGLPPKSASKSVDKPAATPSLPELPKVAEKSKAEIPKIELPKIESPKTEMKANAPKVELPKIEIPKVEVSKVEPKAEPAKKGGLPKVPLLFKKDAKPIVTTNGPEVKSELPKIEPKPEPVVPKVDFIPPIVAKVAEKKTETNVDDFKVAPTLGGKPPVEQKAGLPDLPKDEIPVVEKAYAGPGTEKPTMPPPLVEGEFRVKINRPKLKV